MDDMDMDIDLGDPLPETGLDEIDFSEPQEAQAYATDNTLDLADAELIADKINVRGLDELTTKDITAFALAHFPASEPRVEWIDDTSANLHYSSAELATAALSSLSASAANNTTDPSHSLPNPLQLRAGKLHPTRLAAQLQLRQAISTDRKRPRAHESSRFYLLHPEYDPREQRRQGRQQHHGEGEYSRLRYGDREHRRRRRGDESNGFSASMYDDGGGGVSLGSRQRSTSDSTRMRRRSGSDERMNDDRDRSASPTGRRHNGRDGSRRRRRRRTPPPDYASDDPNPVPPGNVGKELFSAGANGKGAKDKGGRDLFPNKKAASVLKGDLFPDRAKRGRDIAGEAADLFASKMAVPLMDGAQEAARRDEEGSFPLRSDRMGGIAAVGDWSQRDDEHKQDASEDGRRRRSGNTGFSIKGRGDKDPGIGIGIGVDIDISIKGSRGLSIKGSAAQQAADRVAAEQRVRELFPSKVGNRGKELFPERKRNRAEDMFG